MIKKLFTTLAMLALISFLAACGPTQFTATRVVDINPAVVTAPISNASVDALIALVNQYVASGDITGNAENGLLAKLKTIQPKITAGQFDAAVNQLNAFINEVQAQQGKKVSAAAASALIAGVQEVIAEMESSLPTIVAAITPQSTASSTLVGLTAPIPMGTEIEHQSQWDNTISLVAGTIGFTNFTYDAYKLPAQTAWKDTLVYYDAQAALSGWGATHTQTNEIPGGSYAVWTITTGEATSYFVVIQMDNAQEGSFTLNIIGKK